MKVAVIGTGYVGLPTGVGLAELGHDVICVDKDSSKVESLSQGISTIYEDGLDELLVSNLKNKKISFTTDTETAVSNAQIVMIAVGTPPDPLTGEADLKYIRAAAAEVAKYLNNYTVVAIKSTVPVGTGDEVESVIRAESKDAKFDVVSLPEFLREGFAVFDFFNPDRIVVGSESAAAIDIINELYKPLLNKTKMLYVKRRSSELVKYASNAFLAVKIHYINEMADFCEKVNADISEVAIGMGLDSRIGNKFLKPGPGYGGSCFPKDTLAMEFMAKKNDVQLSLVSETIKNNDLRKENIALRVLNLVKDVQNPKIAVLGLAFKDGTDDCRESPAVEIIEKLLAKSHAKIAAYDPKAVENAKELIGNKVYLSENLEEVVKDANIIVVLTEWASFKEIDFSKLSSLVAHKNIFDVRNILDKSKVINAGFNYSCIGS
jgi:UDPglucose 6-dehydrogenase